MKNLYTLLFLLLLFNYSQAQKVIFIYNEAGLRVKRGTEAALPVTLVTFTAEKKESDFGASVLLQWETSTEENSDRFEIERSGNAKSWAVLTSLPATGSFGTPANYEFTDDSPLPVNNYYRLRMVDADGTFAHSQVRHVLNDETWSVYPNPVENTLSVHGEGSSGVKIFNAAGQRIFEGIADASGSINVAHLPAGAYILMRTIPAQGIVSRKFVKK